MYNRNLIEDKMNIFDKITNLKCMYILRPIYLRYKEVILYLFFGGVTFVISIASYIFLEKIGLPILIANLFSWILAVLFAYITNRIWVFDNSATGIGNICKECLLFFSGRVATLIIEELILYVGIALMGINSMLVKVVGQIIVIVSNYFISKILVFTNKD